MSNIVPLFSIPLFIDELVVSQADRDFCKSLEMKHDGPSNMDISIDPRVLDCPEFIHLMNSAQSAIEVYVRDILHIDNRTHFNITTSWYTDITDSSNISNHYHTHSLFTGVIVLEADPGSRLILHIETPPIVPKIFDFDYLEYNTFNSKSWFVDLEPNHIYIFPSTINHSAKLIEQNTKLSLIAFDTFISGSVGEDINKIHISTI